MNGYAMYYLFYITPKKTYMIDSGFQFEALRRKATAYFKTVSTWNGYHYEIQDDAKKVIFTTRGQT